MRGLQWVVAIHTTMAVLLMLGGLPQWPTVALLLMVGASWLWLRRHPVLGFGPHAIVRATWHTDQRWHLRLQSGSESDAELLSDSLILNGLLVLRFRSEDGRRYTRMIFGDEAPVESLRRLRARLSVK